MSFNDELKKMQQENPEWLAEAQNLLREWAPKERVLVVVIAQGLKAMYERGVNGEAVGVAPVRRARTRPSSGATVRTPEPEKPTTVARVRRR